MERLHFSKMHGLGNDFVLLDCRTRPMPLDAAQIRALGDRHTGVGFDQLISIEAGQGDAAYRYGIWNRDGSGAGQCGNGVRCVAAWLHREGRLDIGQSLRLASPSAPVEVQLIDATQVRVDMGIPDFTPAHIPFAAPTAQTSYPLALADGVIEIGAVSMGNPHAVVMVTDLDDPRWLVLGPQLSVDPHFAAGANAGFVQVLARDHVGLRVHERGAGWTRACGSGACAAMAVLHQRGEVDASVRVDLPGGALHIDWPGAGHRLWMTGPATFVFEGDWPVPPTA